MADIEEIVVLDDDAGASAAAASSSRAAAASAAEAIVVMDVTPDGGSGKRSRRQGRKADCVRCKSQHRISECVPFTNCGHTVGLACARKFVTETSYVNAGCPSCGVTLSWEDLLRIWGPDRYAAVAAQAADRIASAANLKSLSCRNCNRAITRAKAGSKQKAAEPPFAFLCSGSRGCRQLSCAICPQHAKDKASLSAKCSQQRHLFAEAASEFAGLHKLYTDRVSSKRTHTKRSKATGTGTAWSSGTGFGGSQGQNFAASVNKAHANEAGQDQRLVAALKSLGDRVVQAVELEDILTMHALLLRSDFSDVCITYLRNDSFMEVLARAQLVYSDLLSILERFSSHRALACVFNHQDPVRKALKSLAKQQQQQQAAQASASPSKKRKAQTQKTADDENDDDDDEMPSMADLLKTLNKQAKLFKKQCAKSDDLLATSDPTNLSDQIGRTYEKVSHVLRDLPSYLKCEETVVVDIDGDGDAGASGGGVGDDAALEKDYVNALKPVQFRSVSMDTSTHVYRTLLQQSSNATTKKDRMRRITKEISSLSASLPLTLASAICVRVDESRPDCLKAMIIGPEGTPYANGCFVFHIFLPPEYPHAPPKVTMVTTGGGHVRFNPNLYACGKVCLSLLGTWSGPGWSAQHSTLLQVLLSIQSLIMVPEPYYNEPGFEFRASKPQSLSYNSSLRFYTMQTAMVGAIESPDPDFRSAIQLHFSHKRDRIAVTCEEWEQELASKEKVYMSCGSVHCVSPVGLQSFRKIRQQLQECLDRFQVATDTIVL